MLKKKTTVALIALLIGLQANPAKAENYDVHVTRSSRNLYKVDGQDVIIQTRFCYVYAYSEEAILKASGSGGDLIFFDSKDKCNVKAAFGQTKLKPGKYVVAVSQEEDDWYRIDGTDSYIHTFGCLSLALGEEAYLAMTDSGYGSLHFRDRENCTVQGIYTKIQL